MAKFLNPRSDLEAYLDSQVVGVERDRVEEKEKKVLQVICKGGKGSSVRQTLAHHLDAFPYYGTVPG